jgi:retron-type reverse transcriptase
LLFPELRTTDALLKAWRAIESNTRTSQRAKTKEAGRKFAADLPRNLRKLQKSLLRGYEFSPVYGAAVPKGPGKVGNRPIAVATLADRVVQRAILDTLHGAAHLQRLHAVLSTPTSVGGLPGRGVDNALEIVEACAIDGYRHVAGSDIANFFNHIPKSHVVEFIRDEVGEEDFSDLFRDALQVEVGNAAELSAEDYRLFPTGDDGVAQGCPLSALAGNIVLRDFDQEMNDPARGLVCVRYIDDFILLGRERRNVERGMQAARRLLRTLKMDAYDPDLHPRKAFIGSIGQDFTFLGHQLLPGRYPPSRDAQLRLKANINTLIQDGQKTIAKAVSGRMLKPWEKPYAATVTAIHNAVSGWRGTYRLSNCPDVFSELNHWVVRRLMDFERYLDTTAPKSTPHLRARAIGLAGMQEGALRPLPELLHSASTSGTGATNKP